MFLNLAKIVTMPASVERIFSQMKLIRIRLRNSLSESTLAQHKNLQRSFRSNIRHLERTNLKLICIAISNNEQLLMCVHIFLYNISFKYK